MAAKLKSHIIFTVTHPLVDGEFSVRARVPTLSERAEIQQLGEALKSTDKQEEAAKALCNAVLALCDPPIDLESSWQELRDLNEEAFAVLMSHIGVTLIVGLIDGVEVKRKN